MKTPSRFKTPATTAALAIVLTVLPFAANAADVEVRTGGSHGGGGNAQVSSRADLDEVVANMRRHVWEISDAYNFGNEIRLTSRPLSPELARVAKAVLGVPYFTVTDSIKSYMEQLKYTIVDGDCSDGGSATDSSTLHQKNAPICLSASRLSRFPKSTLKEAILPLLFHEVAHQFGFAEAEAEAFQSVAALHLKYRPIYLASVRARFQCGFSSRIPMSAPEQIAAARFSGQPVKGNLNELISRMSAPMKQQLLMSCVARATSAGESLDRIYDGDIWQKFEFASLTKSERGTLLEYAGSKDMTFRTFTKALTEPALTGVSDCQVCATRKVDSSYLMMLGAKAAGEYIKREVGLQQDKIAVK